MGWGRRKEDDGGGVFFLFSWSSGVGWCNSQFGFAVARGPLRRPGLNRDTVFASLWADDRFFSLSFCGLSIYLFDEYGSLITLF
jgi:hypothetical protein